MSLEERIRKWVVLDNQHKKICESIKKVREEKNELTQDLMNYFSEKNVKPPNINISDGRLRFIETNVANTLSYKFLEECLNEYFDNLEKSQELIEFIKRKRTYTTNKTIQRIYNK